MTVRRKQKKQTKFPKPTRHMTSIEFRAVMFISTLALAAIAILRGVNDPVVWSFLATAIGMAIGSAVQNNKNS